MANETDTVTSIGDLHSGSINPVQRLITGYCRPYLGHLTFSLITMLLARLLWLLPPVIFGVAIDALFTNEGAYRLPFVPDAWLPKSDIELFALTLILIGLSYLVGSIVYIIGSWARAYAAYSIQHNLRTATYSTIQSLDPEFFESHETGEIMSILNNDVNNLEGFFSGTLQSAGNAAFIVLAVSGYMLYLNWQLALVAFVSPILIGVFNYWYSRYMEPRYQNIRESVSDVNTRVENNISGMAVIKAYAQEVFEEKQIERVSLEYFDASWKVTRMRILMGQITGRLNNLGYLLVFLIGGWWVMFGPPIFFSGTLTTGTLVTFLMFNGQFTWPLQQVTNIVDSYQETKSSSRRVLGVIDYTPSVSERRNPTHLDTLNESIEYENVSFRYAGSDEPIIHDISFIAEPRQKIGIVGATGAGKSTLVKLLLRFYDPDEGRITIGGVELTEISIESLRGNIGYVSQDPHLFGGTIKENIAYGRSDAPDKEIKQAAKRAGAHEFITELSNGYETDIGEKGSHLSGGQQQRLSIARAILTDPDILILDEATSHVDNETEVKIHERMSDFAEDKTTFIIAHQLSTVRTADNILVMEDGEVVERGTHEELLERGGTYRNLWNVQVGQYDVDPEKHEYEGTV